MAHTSRIKPIEATFFIFEYLTDEWQILNPFGLDPACFILKIFNTSRIYGLELSFDGVNLADFLPPIGVKTAIEPLEINTNVNATQLEPAYFKRGQYIYGRSPDYPFFYEDVHVIILGYSNDEGL